MSCSRPAVKIALRLALYIFICDKESNAGDPKHMLLQLGHDLVFFVDFGDFHLNSFDYTLFSGRITQLRGIV